jgi:hypothetical protein
VKLRTSVYKRSKSPDVSNSEKLRKDRCRKKLIVSSKRPKTANNSKERKLKINKKRRRKGSLQTLRSKKEKISKNLIPK